MIVSFERNIQVICSITVLIIFGGLTSAHADTLTFDQPLNMIEHSGVLTADYSGTGDSIVAEVWEDGFQTNSIQVTLYRNSGTNIFTSTWITYTESPSGGTNELEISGLSSANTRVTVNAEITSIGLSTSTVVTNENEGYLPWPTYWNKGPSFSVDPNICASISDTDTDGDGLCDKWENQTYAASQGWNNGLNVFSNVNGPVYNFGCNPNITDISSSPLGDKICPDPNKADIYYEIDWMKGHTPNQESLEIIVEKFWQSDYDPGTGNKGITLHFQLTDNELPHKDTIYFPGGEFTPGHDQLKEIWYGSVQERQDPDWTNKKDLKNYAFHYVIFAHDQENNVGASGIAEIPGNDALITLGSWDGSVGSTDQQASTLMHEMGHNINLNHGGNDSVNCKPNYISIMSHSRQTIDLVPDREIDFSPKDLADIQDFGPAGQTIESLTPMPEVDTVYGNNGNPNLIDTGDNIPVGNIDLNNIDSIDDCPFSSSSQTLTGFHDWDANFLELTAHGSGNWKDGVTKIHQAICHYKNYPILPVTNPADDRVCIKHEVTIDEIVDLRASLAGNLQSTIASIPNGHFQNPQNAGQEKGELLQLTGQIISAISREDMPDAFMKMQGLQEKVDNVLDHNSPSYQNLSSMISDQLVSESKVVPEFGTIALLVLSVSIVTVIIVTSRTKLNLTKFNN